MIKLGQRQKRRGVGQEDLAIDLGTSNTLIYLKDRGIVLDEPTVVALDRHSGRPLASGTEARQLAGRGHRPAPAILVRPLRGGVIADIDACKAMLRSFVQRCSTGRWVHRRRTVICVPSRMTPVEQRAVREAAALAGACYAVVVSKPMAAAIGAGLPVNGPGGNLIVDIGGGTTDIALTSLGSVVASRSLRIAGDDLDAAIMTFVNRTFDVVLDPSAAEAVKITMGSAYPLSVEIAAEVRGSDLKTGLRRTVIISTEEVRHALGSPITTIVRAVTAALDGAPPAVAAGVRSQGITLVGGGAMLFGLPERIQAETGAPVRVAANPRHCVAVGAGRYLEAYGPNVVDHLVPTEPARRTGDTTYWAVGQGRGQPVDPIAGCDRLTGDDLPMVTTRAAAAQGLQAGPLHRL